MSRKRNSSSFEPLEHRTFLSATPQLNITDFSTASDLVGNGFGGTSMTSGAALQMTTAVQHEARSVWYDATVPIEQFRTEFTFRSTANTSGGDGLTFTLQTAGTNQLGADGRGLGYGNMTGSSVAICFNQFNFAEYGSKFGFAVNGERPPTNTTMKNVDLHNGHTFKVVATYAGATLNVYLTDLNDTSKTFAASKQIDLVTALGSKRAIVGFTAGTGEADVAQDVLSWSFAGAKAAVPAPVPTKPHFVSTAAATPQPVTGKTTTLTALGSDSIDAESDLSYKWSLVSAPSGAAAPKFSGNGTNASKSVTATFYKDGTYVFRCTLVNSAGLKTASDVTVRVNQTASAVAMSPHESSATTGHHLQFYATMLDQFGRAMRTQPAFRFSIGDGDGSINSTSGLYTAADSEGHAVVAASAMGLTGSVGVMIKPSNPPGEHSASA